MQQNVQRTLVPLDGSELREGALSYAEGVAIGLPSEVILLTVCAEADWLERLLRAYLEEKAGQLLSLGIKASPSVVQGDAAKEILDFA